MKSEQVFCDSKKEARKQSRSGRFEYCVVCGEKTDVPIETIISNRSTYFPTAGQLCESCCEKIFHIKDLRRLTWLWDEFCAH